MHARACTTHLATTSCIHSQQLIYYIILDCISSRVSIKWNLFFQKNSNIYPLSSFKVKFFFIEMCHFQKICLCFRYNLPPFKFIPFWRPWSRSNFISWAAAKLHLVSARSRFRCAALSSVDCDYFWPHKGLKPKKLPFVVFKCNFFWKVNGAARKIPDVVYSWKSVHCWKASGLSVS